MVKKEKEKRREVIIISCDAAIVCVKRVTLPYLKVTMHHCLMIEIFY